MSYPQPLSVVRGLGQYHHVAVHNPVTQAEIDSELRNRGYIRGEEPIHEPIHEEHEAVLTRPMAIKIAIDYSIAAWNIRYKNQGLPQIPHTASHWYRCPAGICYIADSQWDEVSKWSAMVANGYLNQEYGIPDWGQSMIDRGFRGLGSAGFALGGFSEWSQENPWFFTLIGNLATAYGQSLQAKQVAAALKANVPTDYLKKDDLAAILAALQGQGVIQPGQEKAFEDGTKAATTPSWMMPVMIGGFAVVALLLLQKK